MLWVSFLPSTADDAWTYIQILPGLALIGVGMGIGFPSLNVGAMGAVAGPEVGLASGVLNTARQLGAALGVALLVATFGGALHAHMSWFADERIEDAVDEWEIPGPLAGQVIQSTLHDYTGGSGDRFEPEPGFDEEIIRQTAGSAREGFAWSFRHAALLILSVLPLLGALKRTPGSGARGVHGARRPAEAAAPAGRVAEAGPPRPSRAAACRPRRARPEPRASTSSTSRAAADSWALSLSVSSSSSGESGSS